MWNSQLQQGTADHWKSSTDSKRISIPAFGKLRIDSMFLIRAVYTGTGNRLAYLRIGSAIDGVIQEREQFIQVNIRNHRQYLDRERIKIFDGRSEDLKVFKYDWGAWDDPLPLSGLPRDQAMATALQSAERYFQYGSGLQQPLIQLTGIPGIPRWLLTGARIPIYRLKRSGNTISVREGPFFPP